jgi:hypothetical protein
VATATGDDEPDPHDYEQRPADDTTGAEHDTKEASA